MSVVNTPSKHSSHAATPLPHNSAPGLPPPQTFDVLPPLHSLLTRLVPQANPHPDQQPLEPQQLATEASAIKIRLQKARTAVESLPDMERTTVEQEEEIKQLEDRLAGQKEVLRGLAQAGREQDGDLVMKEE